MATTAQINDLVSLYVGYFNRVPDPEGLQFWIDQIDNGREYGTIAADFAGSVEARSLYPFLENAQDVSPDTFVRTVYQNLFNREPDAEGQAFWVGVLAGGTIPVGDMIESIINGAIDAPMADVPTFDAQVLDNKGIVGLNFVTLSYAYSNLNFEIGDLRAFLEPVTSEPVSVIIAQQETNAFLEQFELMDVQSGYELQIGVDTFSQSEGRLNILTTFDGRENENSLESFDNLNAGSGIDTLNAILNNAGTVTPTLRSVEQIFVEAIGGPSTLDLANAVGVQQASNASSVADFTFQNMDLSTVAGLKGRSITGDTTFDFANADGSDDAATLILDESVSITTSFVTLNDIEDLTMFINGSDAITELTGLIAEDVTSITVTGADSRFLFLNNADSDVGSLEVFDASGFTGVLGVNFDFERGDLNGVEPRNGLTVTGSSDGGDSITLTRASTNDVIVFKELAGSTVDDRTKVTYFNFSDENDKIDISAFGLGSVSDVGTTDTDPTGDVAGFFQTAGSSIVLDSAPNSAKNYIYVDTNDNGNFDADTDLAINVVGVASIDDFILA